MQRLLALLLFVTFSCFAEAGAPFLVKVHAEVKGNGQYLLHVQVQVKKGMRIYQSTDTSLGLEPVKISFRTAGIEAKELTVIGTPSQINDPLFDGKQLLIFKAGFSLQQLIELKGVIPSSIELLLTGFAASEDSFEPFEEKVRIPIEGGTAVTVTHSLKDPRINVHAPLAACSEQVTAKTDSLWLVFLKGLAGGLLALLMPCIFPMIPVTVSFFMYRSGNRKVGIRNGLLYGLYIFLIYLVASLPFHLAGTINPQIFNTISTNMWVNLAFFLVFVIFALSLFGLFELKLPGGWANTAGQKSGLASQFGIFFMALTLAIVSFSCTGPILGILLVNSIGEGNGAWALTAGMAGFGLSLALPFALFALFPQWMKKLPKSGGWMDRVKVSLAFVELALAIKFLSNADLVEHWGILPREMFILLWLVISLLLAGYLLRVPGFLTYRRWMAGTGASIAGLVCLLFTGYLFTGLFPSGRSGLNLLSGLAPPASYSVYEGNLKDVPHPQFINQYEEALAESKLTGKPLLVDFTGWACVNCRKMEELVWTKPEVKEVIDKNFILVSLYVDDRKLLEASEQGVYQIGKGQEKELRTVGDRWAGFQAANFGQVTQPMYALISPDGTLLSHPIGYTPAPQQYKEWLNCGLQSNYESKK